MSVMLSILDASLYDFFSRLALSIVRILLTAEEIMFPNTGLLVKNAAYFPIRPAMLSILYVCLRETYERV